MPWLHDARAKIRNNRSKVGVLAVATIWQAYDSNFGIRTHYSRNYTVYDRCFRHH